MGYERNDRRNYGGYPNDRDRFDYGAPRSRATSYGYGARDYRGDRFDDRPDAGRGDYGRGDYRADYGRSDYGRSDYGRSDYGRSDYGRSDQDRGFFERAGDEVRSWFGDDEAERRRREDVRYDERQRSYGSGPYSDERQDYGYRGRDERDYGRGSSNYAASVGGSAQGPSNWGQSNADRGRHSGHDHSYQSWRDREMQALDRDYHDYSRENQTQFDTAFGSWRRNRQGQREQLNKVQEHQEVVGSDGVHVGTVDHVRGDHIRLTKQDSAAGGHHHAIPSSWIQSVDDKVTLTKTADQAKQHWRDDERGDGGLFGADRNADHAKDGRTDLNRSFSGTY